MTGEECVGHIFRVASSLDSMVVGEPQILGQVKDAFGCGQVKDAFGCAANAQATGNILNRLLHKAFSVAKRVRSETRIATSAVSISFAAVELAKKIFGELEGKTAHRRRGDGGIGRAASP
jgi:glutamyl-tRNA reductase